MIIIFNGLNIVEVFERPHQIGLDEIFGLVIILVVIVDEVSLDLPLRVLGPYRVQLSDERILSLLGGLLIDRRR